MTSHVSSSQREGDARDAAALDGGRAGGAGGPGGPAGQTGGGTAEGAGDQGGREEDEGGDSRAADSSEDVPEGGCRGVGVHVCGLAERR